MHNIVCCSAWSVVTGCSHVLTLWATEWRGGGAYISGNRCFHQPASGSRGLNLFLKMEVKHWNLKKPAVFCSPLQSVIIPWTVSPLGLPLLNWTSNSIDTCICSPCAPHPCSGSATTSASSSNTCAWDCHPWSPATIIHISKSSACSVFKQFPSACTEYLSCSPMPCCPWLAHRVAVLIHVLFPAAGKAKASLVFDLWACTLQAKADWPSVCHDLLHLPTVW